MPAGGLDVFQQYIDASKNYPDSASQFLIEGVVILTLTIDQTGQLTNVEVKEGLGFGCDNEAIRLVNSWVSGWIPANKSGIAVEGQIELEIAFPD